MRPTRPANRTRAARVQSLGAVLFAVALAGCSSSSSAGSASSAAASAPAPAPSDSAQSATDQPQSGFLAGLHTTSTLASTIPENLDVNPYAVLVASTTAGKITKGDVLVDNFNSKANFQGTGTTIVQIDPQGQLTTFAQIPANQPGCPGGIGLSTAMTQLSSGYVIVGSAPSTDGTTATQGAGCLLVLDPQGQVASTIQGGQLDGPWDLTATDQGSSATLYVTNTLHGIQAVGQPVQQAGTVVRVQLTEPANAAPTVASETVIGSGFPSRPTPTPSSTARPGWHWGRTAPSTSPTGWATGSRPSRRPPPAPTARAPAPPSPRAAGSTARWR